MFATPLLTVNSTSAIVKWHDFGAHSDHASVTTSFVMAHKSDKGRGFPKLFKTDITGEKNNGWIKSQIDFFMRQVPQRWDPLIKLDFLKAMLRSKTLELRTMNKRTFGSEAIKEKLNCILSKTISTRTDIDNIEALRLELVKVEDQEVETQRIKSGVKWREEGEKSTRYFLGRFKSRAGATTMHVLNAGRQVISGSTDQSTSSGFFSEDFTMHLNQKK